MTLFAYVAYAIYAVCLGGFVGLAHYVDRGDVRKAVLISAAVAVLLVLAVVLGLAVGGWRVLL